MEKGKKQKVLKQCIIVGISIIVIPSLIIGMVILKQNIDRKKQIAEEEARIAAQVEVPDVIGMTINEARETLNNVNLEIKLTDYDKKLTESSPNEYIVSTQYPSAKDKVDKNTEIELFFKDLIVEKADTCTGMSFKTTKEEYEQQYIKEYKNLIDYKFADSTIKYMGNSNDNKLYCYDLLYALPGTQINNLDIYFENVMIVDKNTNKVLGFECLIDYNSISKKLQETAFSDVIKAEKFLVGEKNVKGNTIFKEILGNIDNNIDKTQTYNDGILYFVSNTNTDAGKSWLTLGMVAVSEDKKEELSEYTNLGQLFMLK